MRQSLAHKFRQASNVVAGYAIWPYVAVRSICRSLLPGWEARIACVVFHDIPAEKEALFRDQVRLLARHFRIVTLPEFDRCVHGETELREDILLLTFDDAYRSHLRAAAILEELGHRGVFFVPAGFPGVADQSRQEELIHLHLYSGHFPPRTFSPTLGLLTWEELGRLVAAGHAVGCHTFWHAPLRALVSAEARQSELVASGDELERRLGCKVDSFATPYGTIESMSSASIRCVSGRYRMVFTSIRGNNRGQPASCLLRETVLVDDSPQYALLQALGGLSWNYFLARRRLRTLAKS